MQEGLNQLSRTLYTTEEQLEAILRDGLKTRGLEVLEEFDSQPTALWLFEKNLVEKLPGAELLSTPEKRCAVIKRILKNAKGELRIKAPDRGYSCLGYVCHKACDWYLRLRD